MKAFSVLFILLLAVGIFGLGFFAMPAFADVSVQDKEVLETVDKLAPHHQGALRPA